MKPVERKLYILMILLYKYFYIFDMYKIILRLFEIK
jgi:hypothetical protein